ncbi:MAG: hypothetical protein ACR2PS_04880 [Pseudomonadales bacterium]
MQQAIKILLSPLAFAIGFLWPLVTQVMLAGNIMMSGWQVWAVAAAIVLPFALMAQFRGSWIWIR